MNKEYFGELGDAGILCLGIGGGGDITTSWVIKKKLESWGFKDVYYGICELITNYEGCEFYNSTGIYNPLFEEIPELFKEEFVLISFGGGVIKVRDSLEELCQRENIGYVLGVNGGGDVLTSGVEPTLMSPVTDSLSLLLFFLLKLPNSICIVAPGVDGELTYEEQMSSINELKSKKGFSGFSWLDKKDLEHFKKINYFRTLVSSFSRTNIAIQRALEGIRGKIEIGGIEVDITELAVKILWISTKALYHKHPFAKLLIDVKSIDEAFGIIYDWLYEHRGY